ncbi:regenerating islet-derived protein 3-alpha-like [Amphibalanus amphitrite]|uniref:regenerating islet-derived protein 3-alpha-like n=1 Tax=Amphibalanus amphitrite TaxID=1232801 RepID=UPI001C913810|nr:regenerating islet-derived protein 3-alpha-like [Amphibalanus amphitrite]
MRLPLALLWATLAPVALAELCVCPPGFHPLGTDRCYHLVADGSFEAVQVACQSLGGQLLNVASAEEDAAARSVMTKHWRAMVWIGLHDESESSGEPEWRWSDGSAPSYTDWHREPGTGRCVVSWLHGGWQQRDCRLPAPGLCVHPLTPPQPCEPPPDGLHRHLPAGDDRWKLAPPPPEAPLPQLVWPPQWLQQRFVLRDAPVQWHQWL